MEKSVMRNVKCYSQQDEVFIGGLGFKLWFCMYNGAQA